MLIATRNESPLVYRAPDGSENSNVGTFHIGTSTILDCTTAFFEAPIRLKFVTIYFVYNWLARLAIASGRTSSLINYNWCASLDLFVSQYTFWMTE